MIIQAELKCKQTGSEAVPCAVDKVIELPSLRFQQFSRALLADYDFIAENKNAIRHDGDTRHCLLILDAEGKDGFLVDPQGHNYARYSAFVPNARSLLTPDMGIDRSYLSPSEPWRNENRDEILRMTLRVEGKPDYTLVLPADEEYLDAVKNYLDTIEDGSRELQLIRERDGRVTNSVVHTQTRDSENERQRIDQIALLDIALRFNPDIICVGEMRGPEANAAQEAARVGIAVLTTIHSNSSEGTYRRMVSLCKRAVDTPDDTLMGYVTEAYPIVVYCRQLENKQRRITNISECEILPDGSRRLHKLYEYHITDNHLEDDHFIIEGEHRKCEEISESLRRRFIENGMPLGELAQFVQGKEEDE